MTSQSHAPLPPFDEASAPEKVRLAENLWNHRDPVKVAQAYSVDCEWRNRVEFVHGREAITALLTRKWQRELDYRLVKELWGFRNDRMAVRFVYEFRDDSGSWFRAHGNELWEFAANGLMQRRLASINEMPIDAADRRFLWPLGQRPEGSGSLSELGF